MKTLSKIFMAALFGLSALGSYAQGYDVTIDGKDYNFKEGETIRMGLGSDGETQLTLSDGGVVTLSKGMSVTFKGSLEAFFQNIMQGMTKAYDYNSPTTYGYGHIMVQRDAMTADVKRSDSGYNWYSGDYMGEFEYGYSYRYTYYTWYIYQEMVNTCNKLITALEKKAPLNEEQQYYLSVAHAFRAMCYLDMARTYEYLPTDATLPLSELGKDVSGLSVPIFTEVLGDTYDYETGLYITTLCTNPRATRKEMTEFILSDLKKAEEGIGKVERSSKRLPDLSAVLGLKVRLQMWNEDYVGARQTARQVIDMGQHKPLTSEEILDIENGFNSLQPSAWMWGAQPSEDQAQSLNCWPSWMCNETEGYASLVPVCIPASLYNKIGGNDVRKQLFKVTGNEPARRGTYYDDMPQYASLKFRALGSGSDYSQYSLAAYPLMRIEEMILSEAEAAAHVNFAEGKQLLENFVRSYRDPGYTCTAQTADELVMAIFDQKRIELWGEGQVYFDYKRLNVPVDRTVEGDRWASIYGFKTTTRPAWMNMTFPFVAYDLFPMLAGSNNPNPYQLYQVGGGFVPPSAEREVNMKMVDGILSELINPKWLLKSYDVQVKVDAATGTYTLIDPFKYLRDSYGDQLSQYIQYDATQTDMLNVRIQVAADGTCTIPKQSVAYSDPQNRQLSFMSNKDGMLKDGVITFPENSIVVYFDNGNAKQLNTQGNFRLSLNELTDRNLYIGCPSMTYSSKGTRWDIADKDGQRQLFVKFNLYGDADEVRVALVPYDPQNNYFDYLSYRDSLAQDVNYGITLSADTAAWMPFRSSARHHAIVYVMSKNGVVQRSGFLTNYSYDPPISYKYEVDKYNSPIMQDPEGRDMLKMRLFLQYCVKRAWVALVGPTMTDDEAFQAWQKGELDAYEVKVNPNNYTSYGFPHFPNAWDTYRPVVIGEVYDGTTRVLEFYDEQGYLTPVTVTYPDADLSFSTRYEENDAEGVSLTIKYSCNDVPSSLSYALVSDDLVTGDPLTDLQHAAFTAQLSMQDSVYVANFTPETVNYTAYLLAYDAKGVMRAYKMDKVDFRSYFQDFKTIATGVFTEQILFGQSWEQVLEYSASQDLYRWPNLIVEGTHIYFKFDGQTMLFTDADGNVGKSFATGYDHPNYGMIMMNILDGYEMGYDAETNEFFFPASMTVSAGSFGADYEFYEVKEWISKPWESRAAQKPAGQKSLANKKIKRLQGGMVDSNRKSDLKVKGNLKDINRQNIQLAPKEW